MNLARFYFFLTACFLGACSEHHDHSAHAGGTHVHQPLRGGILLELGPHGSGHNLELLRNEKDELEIFILDAHAENYIRIKQPNIELSLNDRNHTLTLNAVPDSATGETVGNTSHFRSNQSIANLLPLQGKITAIQIGSKNYVQTAFSFSKNSQP